MKKLEITKQHISKKEVQKVAKTRVKQMLDGGMITALEAYVIARKYEDMAKAMQDELLEPAREEVEMRGSELLGVKIEEGQNGKYNYSSNNEWVRLKQQISEIEEKMKAAYRKKEALIDEETGEIFEPAVYSPSKIYLRVTY